MQRTTWGFVWRVFFTLVMVLATATAVSAQSIVDAGRAEFTPPSDHTAVDASTGVPVIESYALHIFTAGGTAPVQIVNLGKPALQADGMIRLDFLSRLTTPLTPGVIYEAHVEALGPGGSSAPSNRSNTFSFSLPCAPGISPSSRSATASATTGSVAVTAAAGCAWTAASNAAWLTVTSGASGSGDGSVAYSVAANTGTTSRTGTMTIAGSTFTVTQDGVPCTTTLGSSSTNVVATGSTGTVAVTAPAGCGWTAASNAGWITVSSGSTGTGNGSVGYSVAANPTTTSRTGTLTVGGNTFTVTQAGAPCAPTITPASANAGAAGTTSVVSVTAATGCGWTATSNAAWITVSSGATGTGNGSVGYTVAANTATTSRTGTLTVGGNTFTVTQAGATACSYAIAPTSASAGSAGSVSAVTVTAAAGCAWTASSNAPWITITGGATGSGNGSVAYTVAANTGTSSRTGTMSIGDDTFTVTQAAAPCSYSLSASSANAAAAGGPGTVGVTTTDSCSWTAVSNATWITITAGGFDSGNGTVSYTVAVNTGDTSRTGTLTVAGQTFTVTQAGGSSCAYTLSPPSLSVAASGGPSSVLVTTSIACAWTASSGAPWVTITSGASRTGSGGVGFTVAANTTATARTATLTIAGQTFQVTQPSGSCTFTVTPVILTLPGGATTRTLTVTTQSGCEWTSSTAASWISLDASGTGSGSGTFSVTANTGASNRSATISVAGVQITVFQGLTSAAPPLPPTNVRIIR